MNAAIPMRAQVNPREPELPGDTLASRIHAFSREEKAWYMFL